MPLDWSLLQSASLHNTLQYPPRITIERHTRITVYDFHRICRLTDQGCSFERWIFHWMVWGKIIQQTEICMAARAHIS